MHLWRYPSLSIHGIEGAFDKPGTKTVIPGRVVGKFSIRLVPHMNVSVVEKQVTSVPCPSAQQHHFQVLHTTV
jgi:acetylornithine deacetylase/succinyl-diaminopimelate desuccinylase-like protein